MRRNLFIVIVLFLFVFGLVWLSPCVTKGCDASLISGKAASNPKLADNIASEISGENKCVGSLLLSTFRRVLYAEKSSGIDTCVILFHTEAFLADDVLQNELQILLTKFHPDEMSAALKSSGNVHNPKLSFLYTVLKPTIMDTPSMQELSRIAYSYGYDAIIKSLGGEKLQILRKNLEGKTFENPKSRIFGIWGFSARKSGWESKTNLKAQIVDVDAKGNILSEEIKNIGQRQYW